MSDDVLPAWRARIATDHGPPCLHAGKVPVALVLRALGRRVSQGK